MNKYWVSCDEKLYYASKEITAASQEEAEKKFWELFDAGMVVVNTSEIVKLNVDKVK